MAASLKRFFNMVEVTLAIAVVGIGITGIMGMFPVAIGASRDAVAQSFIADGVDQLITLVNMVGNKENTWSTTGYIKNIPTTTTNLVANTTEESACTTQYGNLFFDNADSKLGFANGIAVLKTGTLDSSGNLVFTDFSAGVRFWKTPINGLYLAGNTFNFSSLGADTYKYGFQLHIEISWPLSKDYASRSKSYYTYELFNVTQATP